MAMIFFAAVLFLMLIVAHCFVCPVFLLQGPTSQSRKLQHMKSCALISLSLVGLSITLYGYYGRAGAMPSYYQANAVRDRVQQRKLQVMLANLKRQEYASRLKLEVNPSDAEEWQVLASVYAARQEDDKALRALELALELRPADDELLTQYLAFLSKTQQGVLAPDKKILARNFLKVKPENPVILNLLAVDAFKQQQFKEAGRFWQQAQDLLNADSQPESYQLLGQLIDKAQQQEISQIAPTEDPSGP